MWLHIHTCIRIYLIVSSVFTFYPSIHVSMCMVSTHSDLVEKHEGEMKKAYDALEVKINESDAFKAEVKAVNRKYTELETAKSRYVNVYEHKHAYVYEYIWV